MYYTDPRLFLIFIHEFRQVGDLKRHRELKKCGFTQKDYYGQEEQNFIKLLQSDEIALDRKINSQT